MIDTIHKLEFAVPYLQNLPLNYPVYYNEDLVDCKMSEYIPILPGCAFNAPTKYIWYSQNKDNNNQTILYIMGDSK